MDIAEKLHNRYSVKYARIKKQAERFGFSYDKEYPFGKVYSYGSSIYSARLTIASHIIIFYNILFLISMFGFDNDVLISTICQWIISGLYAYFYYKNWKYEKIRKEFNQL